MTKKVYRRGTLRLELDTSNSDTPAMIVRARNGRDVASATYECGMDNGLSIFHSYGLSDREYVRIAEISDAEFKWLDTFEGEVSETYNIARAGNPDYA